MFMFCMTSLGDNFDLFSPFKKRDVWVSGFFVATPCFHMTTTSHFFGISHYSSLNCNPFSTQALRKYEKAFPQFLFGRKPVTVVFHMFRRPSIFVNAGFYISIFFGIIYVKLLHEVFLPIQRCQYLSPAEPLFVCPPCLPASSASVWLPRACLDCRIDILKS